MKTFINQQNQQIMDLFWFPKQKITFQGYLIILILICGIPHTTFGQATSGQEQGDDRVVTDVVTTVIPTDIERSIEEMHQTQQLVYAIRARINRLQEDIETLEYEINDQCFGGLRNGTWRSPKCFMRSNGEQSDMGIEVYIMKKFSITRLKREIAELQSDEDKYLEEINQMREVLSIAQD